MSHPDENIAIGLGELGALDARRVLAVIYILRAAHRRIQAGEYPGLGQVLEYQAYSPLVSQAAVYAGLLPLERHAHGVYDTLSTLLVMHGAPARGLSLDDERARSMTSQESLRVLSRALSGAGAMIAFDGALFRVGD